jgi:23S rRNA (cytidine1920-2'-O)/16S rRNA (cytidine1409-2'-O)-methyltransferase
VRVGEHGPVALRPSQLVEPEADLIVDRGRRFASRGGLKLDNALEALGVEVAGRDCLDVGASTGGFTDCMLQRGAARVAAVDVAYGQIAQQLRDDPRVTVIERLNARRMRPSDLPFSAGVAAIDVSFISLAKMLPAVKGCLAPGGDLLAMVKPQFEVGRALVGKGGVVRSADDRRAALMAVGEFARSELGLAVLGYEFSGLPGPAGNRESFAWLAEPGRDGALEDLEAAARRAEP